MALQTLTPTQRRRRRPCPPVVGAGNLRERGWSVDPRKTGRWSRRIWRPVRACGTAPAVDARNSWRPADAWFAGPETPVSAELVPDFLELAGRMGDPQKRMETWPVWGSEAHGDLRDMGCSVWLARCGLAGFAVFCELPEGDWCAVGAIKIRRFSSETHLKSDVEMTDHCGATMHRPTPEPTLERSHAAAPHPPAEPQSSPRQASYTQTWQIATWAHKAGQTAQLATIPAVRGSQKKLLPLGLLQRPLPSAFIGEERDLVPL